jgi:hypothetical protein
MSTAFLICYLQYCVAVRWPLPVGGARWHVRIHVRHAVACAYVGCGVTVVRVTRDCCSVCGLCGARCVCLAAGGVPVWAVECVATAVPPLAPPPALRVRAGSQSGEGKAQRPDSATGMVRGGAPSRPPETDDPRSCSWTRGLWGRPQSLNAQLVSLIVCQSDWSVSSGIGMLAVSYAAACITNARTVVRMPATAVVRMHLKYFMLPRSPEPAMHRPESTYESGASGGGGVGNG